MNMQQQNPQTDINNQTNQNTAPQSAPLPYPNRPTNYRISEVKKKRVYTKTESALAVSLLPVGYLWARLIFNSDSNLGKTIFTLGIILLSFIFLKLIKAKPNATALASAAFCAVFGIVPLLSDSFEILFLSVCASQLCYIYFIFKSFDSSVEKAPGVLLDFELVKATAVYPAASFINIFPALFLSGRKDKNNKASKTVLFILIGLLLSVIPTLTVVGFLSYDEGFSKIMNSFDLSDVTERIPAVVIAIPVAAYLFGLWFSGIKKVLPQYNETSCHSIRSKIRAVPGAIAVSAVVPVLAVYGIFFFSQLGYYTSAFGGTLPEGYSFSEYARNGFFELCAVTVINTAILAAFYLFAKRGKNSKKGFWISSAIILICLSNLILIATALSKMLLYINTYGLTLLRVYTTWFMITLALVFVAVIISVLVKKFPAVPIALTLCLISVCILTLSNPAGAVSKYNTQMALEGEDITLDYSYFYELGISAVPDAVALEKSDKVNEATRVGARIFLDDFEDQMEYINETSNIFSFNLPKLRAEKAIGERVAK